MFIYKITNEINGKAYIGCTTQEPPTLRWKTHRAQARFGCQFPLHRAIRKYGVESFSFAVIYECSSLREMVACERGLIAEHGTYAPHGYNITSGGEGTFGRVLTAASRAKMSASRKRAYAEGRGHRRKPGEYRHSAETRAKLGAAARRRDLSYLVAQGKAQAKISDADVSEIRRLLTADYGSPLARMYHVSPSLISAIKHGHRRVEVSHV